MIISDHTTALLFIDQLRTFGGEGADYKERCFAVIDRAIDSAPPKTPLLVFFLQSPKRKRPLAKDNS